MLPFCLGKPEKDYRTALNIPWYTQTYRHTHIVALKALLLAISVRLYGCKWWVFADPFLHRVMLPNTPGRDLKRFWHVKPSLPDKSDGGLPLPRPCHFRAACMKTFNVFSPVFFRVSPLFAKMQLSPVWCLVRAMHRSALSREIMQVRV